MIRYREIKPDFPNIWRVFISGCSSAGKTFFAKQLLDSNLFEFSRIYYFHPDFHENKPVNWDHEKIIFIAGVPTLDEILNIPEKSCIMDRHVGYERTRILEEVEILTKAAKTLKK